MHGKEPMVGVSVGRPCWVSFLTSVPSILEAACDRVGAARECTKVETLLRLKPIPVLLRKWQTQLLYLEIFLW